MSSSDTHVVEPKTYYTIFAILLALLVATILAALIPYPMVNVVVALTIATAKAVLIVLYFMHVRYSTPLVRVVVVAGFAWLLLLIVFTLSDFATRSWDLEAKLLIERAGSDQLSVSSDTRRAANEFCPLVSRPAIFRSERLDV